MLSCLLSPAWLPDSTALASELPYMSNLHFSPLLLSLVRPLLELQRFLPPAAGVWVLRPCACPPPSSPSSPSWAGTLFAPSLRVGFQIFALCWRLGELLLLAAVILLGLFERSCALCAGQPQLPPACWDRDSWLSCLQVMLDVHKVNPWRACAFWALTEYHGLQASGFLAYGPESYVFFLQAPPSLGPVFLQGESSPYSAPLGLQTQLRFGLLSAGPE